MSNGDGLIRSLVDGDLEGFRQGFESFLDQCPSFLYHVSAGRFLPVFFFSMFATAHDANILKANERVYFRFDNHGIDTGGRNRNTGNLKVAVYRDGQQVVRCYSISDRPNSDGLRFSTRERNALVREIRRQNPNLREEDLNFEQYKVCMHGKGKSQGEAIATVFEAIREKDFRGRDKFAKYSASEVHFLRQLFRNHRLTIKEIEGRQLNQNQLRQLDRSVNFAQVAQGQQRIDNFMEILTNDDEENVRDSLREDILEYITDTYNNYRAQIENNIENRSQKFESHGFLLGFLANFSHRYTIGIDLDLSPRNSHVAFLVRHQAERENIPIVINLAIFDTPSDVALNCAIGYAGRLHNSSFIPIHTESRNTVCVGLNFNLNLDPFSVDTVGLQQDRFPLVQRLFECLENEGIRENIRDFLLYHLPNEIPRNAENYNRIFDCITGFAFGSSAFDHEQVLIQNNRLQVTKHIFRYDDGGHALTMVFHAQGSDIVILHIRAHDAQQQGAIKLQDLNMNGNNVHVWEVSCTLNDQFELYIDQPNDLGLYHDYQNNNANNFLDGDLVQVPNAENVHGISERVMNDGWKNVGQHRELFQEISGALMPLMDAINVNSEDKFRSILHGTFYASDNPYKVFAMYKVGQKYSLKRGQEEEGERVILTRITEQRLDLLLLRQPTENDPDTHPIGYVLRFANNAEEVAQKENNAKDRIKELMNKQRGYLLITSGNEVVLFPLIFNAGAERVEGLISIPQRLYIHRLDRSTRGLVGPNSVIDENPPENLLSDQTRENFRRFYTEKKPGQNSIFLLDIDDNLHVPFSYLQGTRAQVIETLKSRIRGGGTSTAQGILQQINAILRRNNAREIEDVHDLLTLDFATDNQNYRYWLQTHDMFFAAQQYTFHDDRSNPTNNRHDFTITSVGVDGNQNDPTGRGLLSSHIANFKQKVDSGEKDRLIAIINVGNRHWVTLVIVHQNGNYYGYYADSLGPDSGIDNNIRGALRECDINDDNVHNVSVHQQTDGHNCGIWVYENARDINQAIDQALQGNNNFGEKGEGIIGYIRGLLSVGIGNDTRQSQRNEQYFKNRRRNISQLFQNDPLSSPRGRLIQDHPGIQHEIDPLLLQFLGLQYPQRGGGGALQLGGERVISIDFGNPQSALDKIDGVSRVYNHSNGRGSR
ncbi:C48 family peptidase [Wolbachia endosymbiont (group A) of Volucella inflata]|uniref:Ulp1 family isopeptidase n=1 Tax=Wolbachia endosymbiont (group A) of Volucella inflata TaxID=2954065 RepID=UPI0029CA6A40|nr:Ulp1 family isopeptidase [Wolbachia endosymbiont (group A) of Volucella inflata]